MFTPTSVAWAPTTTVSSETDTAVPNESVRHRLPALARDPGAERSPSLDGLTAQEHRLLAEVAKGKTDKEVAAELGLSPRTARNYLDRIFTKLGVHTRTEAARACILSGRRRWDPASGTDTSGPA